MEGAPFRHHLSQAKYSKLITINSQADQMQSTRSRFPSTLFMLSYSFKGLVLFFLLIDELLSFCINLGPSFYFWIEHLDSFTYGPYSARALRWICCHKVLYVKVFIKFDLWLPNRSKLRGYLGYIIEPECG